jgi:hypothetical protein
MNMLVRVAPAVIGALLLATPAWAGKPHQHGVAQLDIAVETGKVTIDFESPLDNLVGFERAPRTDAERQRSDAAVATLKAADTLLRIDPAARCSLAKVTLNSAPLQLGTPDPKAATDGHADLDASFEFACKGGTPGFVEVGLFEAFARLQRIEVQTATARGQTRAVLKRPDKRVGLPR